MKKTLFCLLFLFWFFDGQCQVVGQSEYFMLPFPTGKTFVCTQGNYDDDLAKATPNDNIGLRNATHRSTNTMAYAFDFALVWGNEIVSPASGSVVKVSHGYNNGFGNLVIVSYKDGTFGKLCHMADTIKEGVDYLTKVKEGQAVSRGQLIGFCGHSGNCIASKNGDGSHLHYQRQMGPDINGPNSQSIRTSFVEVRENGGRPCQDRRYTSFNYFNPNLFYPGAFIDGWKTACAGTFSPSSDPFAICFNYSGGEKVLGNLQSEVHLYPRNISAANLPWCQDFLYIDPTSRNDYMVILDPYQTNNDIGIQGVCYIVGGQIRSYWMLNYAHLGPPACKEYSWQGIGPSGKNEQYSIQWFQKNSVDWIGVMYSNGKFYEVGQNHACYDPTNVFSGTGQIFCQANCPTGGGDDGEYGMEDDSVVNTSHTASSGYMPRAKLDPGISVQAFDLRGRRINGKKPSGRGIFLFRSEKNVLRKAILIAK